MNKDAANADVAIIGAGPLGIELAVALKKAGIDYVHFDARQIGYTISWFPPQTRFFSSPERIAIAGVPLQTPDQMKATREEYLTYLRAVVQQFELAINTYEPVVAIERLGEHRFLLTTRHGDRQRTWNTRAVVLAIGGTARPRRLDVPGEDLPHVQPHWTDPHDYFQKRVLVVGGKNSAVETAMRFYRAGAKVSLSYRREELPEKSIKYWLLPEIKYLMKSGVVTPYLGTRVTRIAPCTVTLAPTTDNGQQTTDIDFDFVVPQIGYVADMSLCRMAGVDLQGDREVPIYDPHTMQTNVPGVYLCGTVVGGTQHRYEIFIENGHAHVEKIVAHLTGRGEPVKEVVYAQPET
ncbi:MAG TPA: NAD(P)-binding domain-containing protein [Tepidisphaeraceae bacterium]